MFFFRINKLKIFNNFESGFLGIGPGRAEVKLISLVTTDISNMPDLTDFISTNDNKEKKEILKKAVEQVVAGRILTEIRNVKDGHQMIFGDTGLVLFQSNGIPDFFDWQFIAYESDKDVRENAQIVQDVISDKDFDKFSNNLGVIIGAAANPAFAASVAISKFVINTVSKIVVNDKDDMIGIMLMSLNRIEHYLHGERKRDDVPDLTNNMKIDYSLFGFEEIALPNL